MIQTLFGSLEEEKKTGFLDRMKQAVTRTRENLAERIEEVVAFGKEIDRNTLDDLEAILIGADLGTTGTEVIKTRPGGDPAAVLFDALQAATARKTDYVIVDTAGRLHTKTNLMAELEKMRRTAQRIIPGAPHETLLVMDATTGQNGLQQARLFTEAAGVTGIVLTKLDGTAKGGVVVAISRELGVPVRYVGVGEKAGDLLPFDPTEFVDSLFA